MNSTHARGLMATVATATLLPAVLVGRGWAQGVAQPLPPAGGSSWEGGSTIAAGAAIAVAMLLITVMLVKMFDLKRKREAEAVHLQAQVADALLREQSLFRLAITPTARVPLWGGSPAVIELAGQVPSEAELRAVLRVVQQEASRVRADVRIESRIGVVPVMGRRVA